MRKSQWQEADLLRDFVPCISELSQNSPCGGHCRIGISGALEARDKNVAERNKTSIHAVLCTSVYQPNTGEVFPVLVSIFAHQRGFPHAPKSSNDNWSRAITQLLSDALHMLLTTDEIWRRCD